MKVVHFFKAKSRIGQAGQWWSRKEPENIGVEDGPDAILTEGFLNKFPSCRVGEYIFSKPEKINAKLFNKVLKKEINDFKEFINKHLKPGQVQVVVSGDHSVSSTR